MTHTCESCSFKIGVRTLSAATLGALSCGLIPLLWANEQIPEKVIFGFLSGGASGGWVACMIQLPWNQLKCCNRIVKIGALLLTAPVLGVASGYYALKNLNPLTISFKTSVELEGTIAAAAAVITLLALGGMTIYKRSTSPAKPPEKKAIATDPLIINSSRPFWGFAPVADNNVV